MGDIIRLSDRHGVNPTLCMCFWCGEDTGDLALLGRMKGDVEAPQKAIVNYDPCPDCKTNPYTKEDEDPQQDLVGGEEVPEGMLRTFQVKMGDIMVGTASELPHHVVLHIVPAKVAIAVPLDLAYNLHDGLCTAINILDEGASLDVDEDDLPKEAKDWN